MDLLVCKSLLVRVLAQGVARQFSSITRCEGWVLYSSNPPYSFPWPPPACLTSRVQLYQCCCVLQCLSRTLQVSWWTSLIRWWHAECPHSLGTNPWILSTPDYILSSQGLCSLQCFSTRCCRRRKCVCSSCWIRQCKTTCLCLSSAPNTLNDPSPTWLHSLTQQARWTRLGSGGAL